MTGIDERHKLLPHSHLMFQNLDGKTVPAHTLDKDKQILQQGIEIHYQQQMGRRPSLGFLKATRLAPKKKG